MQEVFLRPVVMLENVVCPSLDHCPVWQVLVTAAGSMLGNGQRAFAFCSGGLTRRARVNTALITSAVRWLWRRVMLGS
jgi:hypothetical protein